MSDFKFDVGQRVNINEGTHVEGKVVSRGLTSTGAPVYTVETIQGETHVFLEDSLQELSEDKQVYKTGKLEIYTKDKHGERREIYYKENDDPWKLVQQWGMSDE